MSAAEPLPYRDDKLYDVRITDPPSAVKKVAIPAVGILAPLYKGAEPDEENEVCQHVLLEYQYVSQGPLIVEVEVAGEARRSIGFKVVFTDATSAALTRLGCKHCEPLVTYEHLAVDPASRLHIDNMLQRYLNLAR